MSLGYVSTFFYASVSKVFNLKLLSKGKDGVIDIYRWVDVLAYYI